MSLSTRLLYIVLALVALVIAQWLFLPIYVLVLTQDGGMLALLRV